MRVAGGGLLGSVFLALKARGARFEGTIYLLCAAAATAALGRLAYFVSSGQPLLQRKSTAEEAAPEPAAAIPANPENHTCKPGGGWQGGVGRAGGGGGAGGFSLSAIVAG